MKIALCLLTSMIALACGATTPLPKGAEMSSATKAGNTSAKPDSSHIVPPGEQHNEDPCPTSASPSISPIGEPLVPCDVATPPSSATVTSTGLAFVVLTPGTGARHPQTKDTVVVHYSGWTRDGRRFDSSVARGKPAFFGVGEVVAGWSEALVTMTPGEKRRIWIPSDLYQTQASNRGGPQGPVTFDLELLSIIEHHIPQPPPDLNTPSESATRLPSGVAFQVLEPGDQTKAPLKGQQVVVHYAGWTADGKLFDSSWGRARPARFTVGSIIEGWNQVLPKMTPGQKVLLWVPSELAYGDTPKNPKAPAGPLVFELYLLSVLSASGN